MKETKKTVPTALSESTGAKQSVTVCYKGRQISLSKLQASAFYLISDGKRHSSNNINIVCKTSCARDIIIQLIDKGVSVQKSVVEATPIIPRHKLYWVDPKEVDDVRQSDDLD